MTVSYTLQVATCTGVGCFWRLLFRWRGSTWKLLWPNLLAFVILVIGVSVLHRTVLNDEHKENFQKIANSCKRDKDMIPMAFILGFYVNLVITRWWEQYVKMPWPDGMALYISTLIYGQDDRGRLIRRTLIRYCNLALVLVLRLFSTRIMRRFPTYDHMVDAGLLLVNEKIIIEHVDQKTPHPKYWMPLVWAGGIMVRARKEGRVKDDFSLKTLVDALNTFRGECGGMIDYDWICIPLVYTQVVTLAVYTFIVTAVVGSQANQDNFYVYLPVFSFMQLFFYMGWLKVAESLVNPWGDDDDDFEVNWMVDRHLQVSYMIVDEMHQEHPEMVRDQYWDEIFPSELPYTQASRQYNCRPASSFNLGLDDLIMQRGTSSHYNRLSNVEEDANSDSDGEGDGSESIAREESHPVRIASETQKRPTNREKRSRQAHIDKRFRHTRAATGSRMLYEADTTSLSSLTGLFPSDPSAHITDEDEMFRMSDMSVFSEKEVPVKEPENLEPRDSNSSIPHRSSFKRDLLTDLKPVDLSAPDSDTYLHFDSGGWWRPYTGEMNSEPTESEDDDTYQTASISKQTPPKAKVIVPTGEPITHTFGHVTPDNVSVTSRGSQDSELSTNSIPSDTGEPRPSLIDKHVKFSIPSSTMAGVDIERMRGVHNETMRGVDNETIRGVDNETMRGVHNETMPGVDNETMRGVDNETMRGVDNETMRGVHNETMRGVYNEMMRGVVNETMPGVSIEMMRGVHNETMRGVHNETMRGVCSETMPGVDNETMRGVHNETMRGVDNETMRGVDNETMPGVDEMLTLVPPTTEQFDSATNLAATPTSSGGSTLPTTSLVTTTPPTGTNTTTTFSTRRRSVLSSRVIDMLFGTTLSITDSITAAQQHQQQPQQGGEEVAITIDESADRVSSPYIPSPAIPVPGVSQAHVASPVEPPSNEERDMMEAAMAARRGFHELEPISEQTEVVAGSAQRKRGDEARKPRGDDDADGGGPSSSS